MKTQMHTTHHRLIALAMAIAMALTLSVSALASANEPYNVVRQKLQEVFVECTDLLSHCERSNGNDKNQDRTDAV